MKYYLKKAILFVLIAVLSLIIIGCGKKETPDNSGKKCTIMVECSKIFDNQDKLDKAVKDYIPKDGIILKKKEVFLLNLIYFSFFIYNFSPLYNLIAYTSFLSQVYINS